MASATHEMNAVFGTAALVLEAATGCSAGMSIALICASWLGCPEHSAHMLTRSATPVGHPIRVNSHSTMCRSREVLFRRRPPSSVTVTMSSMRTPKLPGEVDAWLDREAHAGHERLLLALDHVRRLVGGDADAVAGAVDELLAVPRVGDDRDARPGRSPGRPRRGAPPRTPACWAWRTISWTSRISCGGLADAHRAAGVGPVAEHQPAEVEDDAVALLDHPVARLVVRVGAVGSRADHGEVDLLVAELRAAARRGRRPRRSRAGRRSAPSRSRRTPRRPRRPQRSSGPARCASLTARSIGMRCVIEP